MKNGEVFKKDGIMTPGDVLPRRTRQRLENPMNATVLVRSTSKPIPEFEASYTYLAMAGFCDRQKFLGAAKWLKLQSDEERLHGLKLFDFVLRARRRGRTEGDRSPECGVRVAGGGVRDSAGARAARHHADQFLYELCFTEKAFAEMTELQWFLTEQVEEEKTAREIVAKFRLVKNDPAAILDLDRELGVRSTAQMR